MTLLVFALIVLLVAGLAAYALRLLPIDATIANAGSIVLLLVAVLVIAQRAGIGL